MAEPTTSVDDDTTDIKATTTTTTSKLYKAGNTACDVIFTQDHIKIINFERASAPGELL